MQIPGANQRSSTLMKFTFPLCYVAGTDKRGTRTNQRTFRSGSNKYPRGEVCQRRLQRRLCFDLPPPFQRRRRRRRRWLKFMPDGTTPIPPARVAIPTPPQILVGVSRAIHPWESSVELLVPSMTTTTIQMFPDSIRFRFSCTAGRNGSFYICRETRNVLFRILSIEGEERLRKERNGLMLRWKIKLCKSFFLKSYELSRNRRIESSWNGEKLYTSFLICRYFLKEASFEYF